MKLKIITLYVLLIIGIFTPIYGASNDEYSYSKLTETLLNQDPDPVQPGDYVEIRFKIEKEGNEKLQNIEYELVPEYPFSFDESDTAVKTLGNWEGNNKDDEYYILYYKLKVDDDALEGNYELTLEQTSDNTNTIKEIDFNIRVDEKKIPNLILGLVASEPTKVTSDYDDAQYDIEIVNNGDDDAENVIINLNLPDGFKESYGYSTIANLGTISAGSSKIATFYLDTDKVLNQGNYLTTLYIEYSEDDDGNNKHYDIELPVELKIFGKPMYEITNLEFDESKLVAGAGEVEIRLTIKNIGSKDAEETSVQIFKDSSQPFDFDSKIDYIGKLEVGESTEAIYIFDIEDDALAKDYNLDLQFRSVIDDEVLIEEDSITLPISKNQSLEYFKIEYLLVILIFIAGYLGFYFGKKQLVNIKK